MGGARRIQANTSLKVMAIAKSFLNFAGLPTSNFSLTHGIYTHLIHAMAKSTIHEGERRLSGLP